jgi:hypothetical protein
MARPALLLALALTALAAPGAASGKEFASLVVVGSDGRAIELRPGWRVIDGIELAFERWALGRPTSRPTRCLRFASHWRGPQAARRPRRFCLSAQGAYARGRLYPYGAAVWRFLVLNGR